jgi:hypothetical protein
LPCHARDITLPGDRAAFDQRKTRLEEPRKRGAHSVITVLRNKLLQPMDWRKTGYC